MKKAITILFLLSIGIASFILGSLLSVEESSATRATALPSSIPKNLNKPAAVVEQVSAQTAIQGSKASKIVISPLALNVDVSQLVSSFLNQYSSNNLMQVFYLLHQLSLTDLKYLYTQVQSVPKVRKHRKAIVQEFIVGRMSEIDCIATLLFISGSSDLADDMKQMQLRTVISRWAISSPELSLKWLLTNTALTVSQKQKLIASVTKQLALKSFTVAIEVIEEIDHQYRQQALIGVAMASKTTEQFLFLRGLAIASADKEMLDKIDTEWMTYKPAEMAIWVSEQFSMEEQEPLKLALYERYALQDFVDAGIWYESNSVNFEMPGVWILDLIDVSTDEYQEIFDWLETRPELNHYYDAMILKVLSSNPELAYLNLSNSSRLLENRERYLQVYSALIDASSDLAEQMRQESPYADDMDFIELATRAKSWKKIPHR